MALSPKNDITKMKAGKKRKMIEKESAHASFPCYQVCCTDEMICIVIDDSPQKRGQKILCTYRNKHIKRIVVHSASEILRNVVCESNKGPQTKSNYLEAK